MPLSKETIQRIQDIVSPAYVNEAKNLLRGRERWKTTSDTFEALSKIVSALATIMAFAASSGIHSSQIVTDWLSFSSGCLGTSSLMMLVFAGYSAKSSRSRTTELNDILARANITPMPQIAYGSNGDDTLDATDRPSSSTIRLAHTSSKSEAVV